MPSFRWPKHVIGVACLILFFSSAIFSREVNPSPPIKMNGSVTLRHDHYGANGDLSGSPYQTLGDEFYSDFDVSASRQISQYDKWQFELNGLYNESIYRSSFEDFVVERFHFKREKGDGRRPMRLQAGDVYGNFSYRTLQRSLRGLTLELQSSTREDRLDSFVILYGFNATAWRDLSPSTDNSTGFSWVREERGGNRYSLNHVFNSRAADDTMGTLSRKQNVSSAAIERKIRLFGDKATIEAEIARFNGDHDGTGTPASGQNQSETGIFTDVSGGHNFFNYRVRFEDYGRDFRPTGATVPADRRSLESFFTWKTRDRKTYSLRMQQFTDNNDSANSRETRVTGLNYNGLLNERHQITGSIQAFYQEVSDENSTVDNDVKSINASLSKQLTNKTNVRLGVSTRYTDDSLPANNDNKVLQQNLDVDRSLPFFGMPGRLGLSFVNRHTDGGNNKSTEWIPAIALSAGKGPHDIGLNLSYPLLNYDSPATRDVRTAQVGFRYQHRLPGRTIGLEYNRHRREVTDGSFTSAYQFGAFVRLPFGRSGEERSLPTLDPSSETPDFKDGLDIASIDPGAPFNQTRKALEDLIGGAKSLANGTMTVFDTQYFDDVGQRQRLVLNADGDKVIQSAVIIDIDEYENGTTVGVIFERVKRILLRQYGSPTRVYEQGQFSDNLQRDLLDGLFAKVMEWNFQNRIVRFGIPRRLDGRLRIELQVAREFPLLQDGYWSLEAIR